MLKYIYHMLYIKHISNQVVNRMVYQTDTEVISDSILLWLVLHTSGCPYLNMLV